MGIEEGFNTLLKKVSQSEVARRREIVFWVVSMFMGAKTPPPVSGPLQLLITLGTD